MKNIWGGAVALGGDNLPSPVEIGLSDLSNMRGGGHWPPWPLRSVNTARHVHNSVCWPRRDQSKGEKVLFLKSKKIGKKIEKNAAAYDAERPLLLDSFLKLKIHGL